MKKSFIMYCLPVLVLFSLVSESSANSTILTDEVVEIYRGDVFEGSYQYSGNSVDRSGNKLFHFSIRIHPTGVLHIRERDDYVSFRMLEYILETKDYRVKSYPCDIRKMDLLEYKRCINKKGKYRNVKEPWDKKVFTQTLPKLELVRKVHAMGKTPLDPVIERENLRISVSFFDGRVGKNSEYYSRLQMRIVIELLN
jgi:hypothetical protein